MNVPRIAAIVLALTWATFGSPFRAQEPPPGDPPGNPPVDPSRDLPRDPLQDPPQDPSPPPAEPTTPGETPATEPAPALPAYQPRYHALEEVEALLGAWIASAVPDRILIEPIALPETGSGLRVPAFVFGAPGKSSLADRPTALLLGGLDGISLAGSEAVLAVCSSLLSKPEDLPRDVAFVAVPWASPEALAETSAGRARDGRDLTPIDDDGDGTYDEDGPDDLDGDQKILDLLIEDPAGPWARAVDPRFLAPARPGDAPRYALAREGRDDDRDGKLNEDGRGGVAFDRAFPVGWTPARPLFGGAHLPLEVPSCRALADLALSRRTVLVLLFQGDHGGLALPGSREENPWPRGADAAAFEIVSHLFSRATGRSGPPPAPIHALGAGERPGAALDWFYAVPGALALEVSVFGPTVERPGEAQGVGLTEALFEGAARGNGSNRIGPPVSPSDLAWARWLDNTRGGIGFVDWHPVDLGEGREGLVGGWETRSRWNPPESSFPAALAGMPEFVHSLAAALPNLELRLAESRRDGEVCTIRARIGNLGALPSGGWVSGRSASGNPAQRGARIWIELPAGARLLAGVQEVALGEIAGGGASPEVSWIVLAPPGSVMTLRASAPWAAEIAREVKP